jgi:lipid-binding SYLF domain-containing protein
MKPSFSASAAFAASLLLASTTIAGPFKPSVEKLDQKMYILMERFTHLQSEAGKKVPGDLIKRAHGIVIIQKVKVGLGFGGEAGGGIALVRDMNTNEWSAPAFVASGGGSYGLQIGVEESTIVMLLMNEKSLDILRRGKVDAGIEFQATAGPADANAGVSVDNIDAPILVYTNSGGLFAGAAFKSDGIIPAQKRNEVYYGSSLQKILFQRNRKPTKTGQSIIDILRHYSGEKVIEGNAR